MVTNSNLNEVVVLEQKEDDMLVPEGGHAGGGMEEQLHLGKFITSQKVLCVGHFYCLMSV